MGNASTDLRTQKEHSERLKKARWQRNVLLIFLSLLLLFYLLNSLEKISFGQSVRKLARKFQKSEELNESKDQLFAILSHDLRSAVRTLQLNLSRLQALLTRQQADEAFLLARSTEQLIGTIQSLLDNLLYWALSQTGQVSYHPERIAVKPLVDQVCYDFRAVAASKNIHLTDAVAEGLSCTGDVQLVKIILRNLLDNALKYTPPNGAVTVLATQEGERCSITVQDNGVGMDAETIKAVWNNASRRIQEDTEGRRSTGLGFWLVRTMAEKNGGSVRIWSEKGSGTRVTLLLPADSSL